MNIIVRACGERTEKECIRLAEKQGRVHVVRTMPFGESIRQTYALMATFDQEWTPVIDADVLLYPDVLAKAVRELTGMKNVFCLDGKTDDKIMMCRRRAGIHIYKTVLAAAGMKYVDDNRVKPESHVRKCMEKLGYKTHVSKIIFGKHDYEQYYRDLWRKSACQTKKLAGKIAGSHIREKWRIMARTDKDYAVVLAAHNFATRSCSKIIIDARIDYGARYGLQKLRIKEKGILK